jgi:hypothetical protein
MGVFVPRKRQDLLPPHTPTIERQRTAVRNARDRGLLPFHKGNRIGCASEPLQSIGSAGSATMTKTSPAK